MAQIRQEINILNHVVGISPPIQEVVRLVTTKYSGTVTYYYEVVAKVSSGTMTCLLRRAGTATDDATISVSGTTYALYRSTSFSPPAGSTDYVVWTTGAGTNGMVKSARIIIIQSGTPITSTQTQIDIGAPFTVTSSTLAALSNPKYWLYTSANWDGTITAYWETAWTSNSTKITATAQLQVSDGTGDNFTGWTAVGSDLTTTSATTTLSRSSAITLTAGRNYRVVYKTSNSKSAIQTYDAKIIIDQTDSPTRLEPQYLLANAPIDSGTALQLALTKWDSTEWSGVTTTYKNATDAADGSTSDTTIEEADGGGTLTNSTVTDPDNQGISSSITMPTSQDLDTKATTNNDDIYAVRILVAVSPTFTFQQLIGVNQPRFESNKVVDY